MFFFFQAEDGIRDYKVTGVQTCALPICRTCSGRCPALSPCRRVHNRRMSNSKTLVLIDGSSYLYRAYHAMPDLRAEPGNPESPATGAIRGMINMLQAIRKEEIGRAHV